MEIQGPGQPPRIKPLSGKKGVVPTSRPEGAEPAADTVRISGVGRILSDLSKVPEVRSERVDEIRSQIQAGNYDLSDKLQPAIDRLLDDLLNSL